MADPWERLDGEPAKWYARFEKYRLLGPNRSLDEAWRVDSDTKRPKSQRASGDWPNMARRWRWRERAEAWDEVERVKLRKAREQELKEARERHLSFARLIQQKAVERINKIDPDELKASESWHLLRDGVALEVESLTTPLIAELQEQIAQVKQVLRELQDGQGCGADAGQTGTRRESAAEGCPPDIPAPSGSPAESEPGEIPT